MMVGKQESFIKEGHHAEEKLTLSCLVGTTPSTDVAQVLFRACNRTNYSFH